MIYIDFYHGRESPDQRLNGWGFQGPVLGPFTQVQFTYWSTLRALDPQDNDFFFGQYEDLFVYDGLFYGDISFHSEDDVKSKDRKWFVNRIRKPQEDMLEPAPLLLWMCGHCGYRERMSPVIIWKACPSCGDTRIRHELLGEQRIRTVDQRYIGPRAGRTALNGVTSIRKLEYEQPQ